MVPGLGIFSEAYTFFAIGNITVIFQHSYVDCFTKGGCPNILLKSFTYTQIAGNILGMTVIGAIVATKFGRKIGSK